MGDTVREAVVESEHRGITACILNETDPQQMVSRDAM